MLSVEYLKRNILTNIFHSLFNREFLYHRNNHLSEICHIDAICCIFERDMLANNFKFCSIRYIIFCCKKGSLNVYTPQQKFFPYGRAIKRSHKVINFPTLENKIAMPRLLWLNNFI